MVVLIMLGKGRYGIIIVSAVMKVSDEDIGKVMMVMMVGGEYGSEC